MTSTRSRPLHERLELLLSPEAIPARAKLMDVHPLLKNLVGRFHVLLDQPLHHRESWVSVHARLLEVFHVRQPPADHILAARIAQARETAVELPHDDGELGVKLRGEGVRIGVAAATNDGDFEGGLVGYVDVESVVDIHLHAKYGELGEL